MSRPSVCLSSVMLLRPIDSVEVLGNIFVSCNMAQVVRTTTQLGCCPCVLLTAYPFLDPGLNEKIFTDTAGSAMMDTPGKN